MSGNYTGTRTALLGLLTHRRTHIRKLKQTYRGAELWHASEGGSGKRWTWNPLCKAFWNFKYEEDIPDRGSMNIVQNMTQHSSHVSVLPTMEGGIGRKKLQEFCPEFFIPSLVDDFKVRLMSRTMGPERIVDEMVVSFTYSDEIDWILPGIQPTDAYVEIVMVSGMRSLEQSESVQQYSLAYACGLR
jgi:hypothetical protein